MASLPIVKLLLTLLIINYVLCEFDCKLKILWVRKKAEQRKMTRKVNNQAIKDFCFSFQFISNGRSIFLSLNENAPRLDVYFTETD